MAQYSCKSIILILLYADDVLFSYTLDDMQHLLDVLETFCQIRFYAMSLDFKQVGIVIICLRIYAAKVIL